MGRGSERRILITATRTSSLGGTIWQCHTDACNPVGCSLPLDAHFVHFGSWGWWGGAVRVGRGRWGVPRATCRLFVESFIFSALMVSVITYCWMEEPEWLQREAPRAELTFAKMHSSHHQGPLMSRRFGRLFVPRRDKCCPLR